MSRIRSIKPEFWSDQKVAQLSHSCAAFFIGLWNFCDDEGKCEDSPAQLALRMPIFRREDISRWIKQLVALGLLQRGSLVAPDRLTSGSFTAQERLDSGSPAAWLRVTNWSHQKIDRPRVPKIKLADITWISESDSSKPRERSSNVRRKDRIGEDRIGSDRIGSDDCDELAEPRSQAPENPIRPSPTSETWTAYKAAYLTRYKTEPTWNARVAGQIKHFIHRVPQAEAPPIAEFFVSHNGARYVASAHAVGLLLQDAEKLRTEWLTGRRITSQDARSAESGDSLRNQLERLGRTS